MADTIFLRQLADDDKAAALKQAVHGLRDGDVGENVFAVEPESFRQVPGASFACWVSDRVRPLLTELACLESEGRTVKQGLATESLR